MFDAKGLFINFIPPIDKKGETSKMAGKRLDLLLEKKKEEVGEGIKRRGQGYTGVKEVNSRFF